ncbi:hypothetical protein [Ruminococcus albus]|uniref:Uncharacterized protein n=1 Tax=Ruminococcus albus (strain ATCC 27210 / DSM 20455 / JCM 14654 / NCDO 2250 / 7) TaxID=697329 RepID=E6UJP2_RUMA7|nr:hypothetical protein [Ruminococcus albus]ADU23888.1 hypothetical protein Rumal_3440 [Ruminococcus albus 7 = DSM 20455]
MKIKFSVDGIKNMDLLYTWHKEMDETLGFDVSTENYHGTEYCQTVIKDIVEELQDIVEDTYIGQLERIANETFELKTEKSTYQVSFAINTYNKEEARVECIIFTDDCENYDKNLEKLKIILKNRLILDWRKCTWLVDEQSEYLCREAFQKTYHVENNLRAFASKVLIHFLGVNWIETWDALDEMYREQEEAKADEEDYYRDRLASETGMDILDDENIIEWFDEVINDLYDSIYQHYHLETGFEISDLSLPSMDNLAFSVQCMVVEDGTAVVEVITDYSIDSSLGGTSICTLICKNNNKEVFTAEIRFHNGNGFENEECLMEVIENTEYDDSEIEEFKEKLIDAINKLNPYPAILKQLEYESKGCDSFVADFPCEQCDKLGVSLNERFLTIGRCYFCGYEHELDTCIRCGELFNANELEDGFCSNCADYIEKQ